MNKRLLPLFLIVVAFIVIAAGCGGNNKNNAPLQRTTQVLMNQHQRIIRQPPLKLLTKHNALAVMRQI